MELEKYASRKFLTAGGCIAVLISLNASPNLKAVLLAVIAIVYITIQAVLDNKTKKEG